MPQFALAVQLTARIHHALSSAQVRALLYFSDQAPQGLLEGLDAHFPDASSLGLTAPPTPFETGRPQTLLCARPNVAKSDANAGAAEAEDAILDKGAVGLALVAKEGTPAGIQVEYEGLKELGPRREITSARGNIISTLAGQNATQLFLRDIQARDAARRAGSAPSAASGSKRADDNASASATATATASEPSIEAMSRGLAREIASGVSKEEEFVVGVFDREQPGSEVHIASFTELSERSSPGTAAEASPPFGAHRRFLSSHLLSS